MASLRTRNKKRKVVATEEPTQFSGVVDLHTDQKSQLTNISTTKPNKVKYSGRTGSSQHVLYKQARVRFLMEGVCSSLDKTSNKGNMLLKVDPIVFQNCKDVLAASLVDLHGAVSSFPPEDRDSFYSRSLYESDSGNHFVRVQVRFGNYSRGDKAGQPIVQYSSKVDGVTLNDITPGTRVTIITRAEVWNDDKMGEGSTSWVEHGRPTTKFIATHLRMNELGAVKPSQAEEESIESLLSLARGSLHHLRE